MIHLTADDTTLLKDLALFVEPVEISDADGKLVGLFVPASLERGKELYASLAARTARMRRTTRASAPLRPATGWPIDRPACWSEFAIGRADHSPRRRSISSIR